MTSVLQGGRRRRRPGVRIARLLILLAPLAVIAAVVFGVGGPKQKPAPPKPPPPQSQQLPGAPPTPGPAAPAPAQAAPAGVDAFHLRFSDPPRAGIVFDVKTGEVLWRLNPLAHTQIASLTKIMTALLVVENTKPDDAFRIPK